MKAIIGVVQIVVICIFVRFPHLTEKDIQLKVPANFSANSTFIFLHVFTLSLLETRSVGKS